MQDFDLTDKRNLADEVYYLRQAIDELIVILTGLAEKG